jgi:hypothetical protein
LSLEEFKNILKKTFKEENVKESQQKVFFNYIDHELEIREKETSPLHVWISS